MRICIRCYEQKDTVKKIKKNKLPCRVHSGALPRNPHNGTSRGGWSLAPGQWIFFPATGEYDLKIVNKHVNAITTWKTEKNVVNNHFSININVDIVRKKEREKKILLLLIDWNIRRLLTDSIHYNALRLQIVLL